MSDLSDNELDRARKAHSLICKESGSLLDKWVDTIKEKIDGTSQKSDDHILDHITLVVEQVCEELEAYISSADPLAIESYIRPGAVNRKDSSESGCVHGRQRAAITAYNVEKIYLEYVYLREVLITFLEQNNVLTVPVSCIVTATIERCTREAISAFSESVRSIQQKVIGALVHDLRNPLNVINLISQLLPVDNTIEKLKSHKETLARSIGRMSFMLEDMLQTVSVDGGQGLDLHFDKVDVSERIDSLREELDALYGARLIFSGEKSSVIAIVDIDALVRTIENLLSNAFKFGSPSTDVLLTLRSTESDLIVTVHNQGNPIDPGMEKELFTFLKSGTNKEKYKSKSWGIGLAVSKAAAQGHDGDISVSSTHEEGTCFTLTIPRFKHTPGGRRTVPII